MQIIKINCPAIQKKLNCDELNIKECPVGYKYIDKSGAIIISTVEKPVYRYAKSYFAGKNGYTIIMITTESNTVNIQKYFDKLSKTITATQAKEFTEASALSFKYLNVYYGGNK